MALLEQSLEKAISDAVRNSLKDLVTKIAKEEIEEAKERIEKRLHSEALGAATKMAEGVNVMLSRRHNPNDPWVDSVTLNVSLPRLPKC